MKFALKRGIEDGEEGNKKRKLFIGLGAAVGLCLVIGTTYAVAKRSGDSKPSSEFGGKIEVKQDACKLFTLDDAKKILGNATTPSSTNANAVTEKVSTSLCSYSSNDSDESKLKVVTVLARTTNPIQARQAFEVSKAPNAVEINEFGRDSYYNPDVSQLNILKNDLLIRIASTEGSKSKGMLDTSTQVGRVIVNKL